MEEKKAYTIGHSTHSKEEFLSLLEKYNIRILVDVRSYPGSRYVPQFNKENMEEWITDTEIKYIHMKDLGGRRKLDENIDEGLINGWTSASFKNYASYSLTDEYESAIGELIGLVEEKNLAYMCSEAVPWRCHRLLISNSLVAKGVRVYHIISEKELIEHKLGMYGAEAKEIDGKVIYPE